MVAPGTVVAILSFALQTDAGEKVSMEVIGKLLFTNGNASGLALYQNYLYMVTNESVTPLLVYDISDPLKPRLLKRMRAPGWPLRCRLIGKHLWTIHGNGEGFFSLEDPSNPVLLKAQEKAPAVRYVSRGKFRRHPNLTYIACASGHILFYGTKRTEVPEKDYETQLKQELQTLTSGEITETDSDEILDSKRRQKTPRKFPPYITEIYDISNPARPSLLATIDSGAPTVLQGTVLFVSGESIQLFDVSSAEHPRLLGELRAPEGACFELRGSAVAIGDGRLYVGIRRDFPNFQGRGPFDGAQTGIAVFDATNLAQPRLLGYCFVPDVFSSITTIAYRRGYIFASDSAFGLRVFDVRDPANIREVARDRQGGELSAVALVPERRLLVLGQNLSGGIYLVDVSHPASPRQLGYFRHGLRVWGTMAVYRRRFLYFQADISRPRPGVSLLYILDTEEPSRPRLCTTVPDVPRS